jgi:hypothetical protein
MQFKSFEPGIEVKGKAVHSVIDGLVQFKILAKKLLLDAEIGKEEQKEFKLDPDGWYSLDLWLNAFEKLSKDIGDSMLKMIGSKIPENAEFPSDIVDLNSAIKSVDIAYHMNHRKEGIIMYDISTRTFTEGIGHYGYEKIPGKNLIISECRNPYPCAFDFGILTAMAKIFEPNAFVESDTSKPCRKYGADSCTYLIAW